MDNYKRILSGHINEVDDSPSKKGSIVEKQMEAKSALVGNNKQAIINGLGHDLFSHVYEFLKYHRRRGTDEKIMHEEIRNMVRGDKTLMTLCF